ncbi:unnamed protein product [Dibothriocephalus latus]|uniref:Uncharacterized protein n=1 Tax=Dibothriocephalus latus TaxID=60516 RepID=A0A3P7M7H9_DIBLA|nr:unnamed protein product [Dibothriocephalus latus]
MPDIEDDDEEEEEDEDEEEEDESELASTLAQLMRENKRLEALNTSYVEKIIAQRNSCTDLKVTSSVSSFLFSLPLLLESLSLVVFCASFFLFFCDITSIFPFLIWPHYGIAFRLLRRNFDSRGRGVGKRTGSAGIGTSVTVAVSVLLLLLMRILL